jgi:excisionase family DNA binding protein
MQQHVPNSEQQAATRELDKAIIPNEEAMNILGISRQLFYHEIANNKIPHIRLGNRILVPRVRFEKWLAEAPANV